MKIVWFPTRTMQSAQPIITKPCLRQRMPQRVPLAAFTTSSCARSTATREVNFSDEGLREETKSPQMRINARLVPASPSYFTGSPRFIDNYVHLQALLRKFETLPVLKPNEAPRQSWRTLMEYRNLVGEDIGAAKYQKIIQILRRLSHIHPTLMPGEVKSALEEYRRHVDPNANAPKPILIDPFGRALGVGRRKSSTARAWVVEGNGEVLVNGKTLAEAFSRVHDRESVIWALKATERVDKYNVWALSEGGGTTGQAEALTLAIAKALLAHEPALKPALRRAGCVTRDPRRVERKKPGHVKARKMPTWVKR